MARIFGIVVAVIVLASSLSAAQLAPAEASVFMGSWTLALDTPQGNMEQSLILKDEAGKVVGEMSSQMAPEVQKVTDINKKGEDLILKFAGNFQGNPFDAIITMTPDGTDKCKVTFDVNGGQFTMSGTGTKK